MGIREIFVLFLTIINTLMSGYKTIIAVLTPDKFERKK